MSYSDRSNQLSTFPNRHSAIAELRPHSLTIHLHTIRGAAVPELSATKNFSELSRKVSIITHEQTHWLDLVATVWGQEYLLELFDAYDSLMVNTEQSQEYDWWKIVRLYDQDRRIMFPRYYKTLIANSVRHSVQIPWSLDFSFGQEFGPTGHVNPEQPIAFALFGANPSRERIARQPMSVGSLLECNAVHFEILDEFHILKLIEDDSERMVEQRIRIRERSEFFYDENLLDYTVAAHVLSARAGLGEPVLTYRLSSEISSICLNLVEGHFKALQVPEEIKRVLPNERITAFKKASNRGFAFLCLAFGAPQFEMIKDEKLWLEAALKGVGLPSRATIAIDASQRLLEIRKGLNVRSELDKTRNYLLEIGREILPLRMKLGDAGSPSSLLSLGVPFPMMFDSNGELFTLYPNGLDAKMFDAKEMFDWEWRLREFTANFLIACRGL